MTPTEEQAFIALWSQGLSQDAIAQQLGIPVGTVKWQIPGNTSNRQGLSAMIERLDGRRTVVRSLEEKVHVAAAPRASVRV